MLSKGNRRRLRKQERRAAAKTRHTSTMASGEASADPPHQSVNGMDLQMSFPADTAMGDAKGSTGSDGTSPSLTTNLLFRLSDSAPSPALV